MNSIGLLLLSIAIIVLGFQIESLNKRITKLENKVAVDGQRGMGSEMR